MRHYVSKVHQIQFHRNGIGGTGFNAVLFEGAKPPEQYVAIVFDEPGSCAVLRIPDLSDLSKGVLFGINSWRGDNFEPELRQAIKEWDEAGETGRAGPFSLIPLQTIAEATAAKAGNARARAAYRHPHRRRRAMRILRWIRLVRAAPRLAASLERVVLRYEALMRHAQELGSGMHDAWDAMPAREARAVLRDAGLEEPK